MIDYEQASPPEKLYLLAGELLRDSGCENVQPDDLAALFGCALAFSHLEASSEPDNPKRLVEYLSGAIAHAAAFHKRFVRLADTLTDADTKSGGPSPSQQ